MGRYSQSPNLYDEVITIDISDIKKWGYLKPDQIKTGLISWKRFGQTTNSIDILVNTRTAPAYIELQYTYRGSEKIRYKIDIVTVPSNLNRGEIHYFRCPITAKRCRKLYYSGKYFLHREAGQGMYRIQTLSEKQRNEIDFMQKVMQGGDSSLNIRSKHYKRHYAGKPTKRFIKDWKRIQRGGQITIDDFNSIYR